MFFSFLRPPETEFVRLQTGLCKACWRCVRACPQNVLDKVDVLGHRHARIRDPHRCMGCLKCTEVCAFGAVSSIERNAPMNTIDQKPVELKVVKRVFNKRAFTSVAMVMSGLILPVSGTMNHDLQFSGLTTERHFWMAVHNIAATLFIIFGFMHVTFNWKALSHYIVGLKKSVPSREALAAISLVILVVGVFASHALHAR